LRGRSLVAEKVDRKHLVQSMHDRLFGPLGLLLPSTQVLANGSMNAMRLELIFIDLGAAHQITLQV
jgi:hypothetical protein